MSETFEMVAKTLYGLEEILAGELLSLGANDIQIGRRMVSFTGDKEVLYKANFCCRTALRILKPIYHFKAKDADTVYKEVKKVKWENYISLDKTFAIDSVIYSEDFNHSKFVAYRTKDAIVDYFMEKDQKRPSVRVNNPDLYINIHISHNDCTLSIDSSGESLHKRGYRVDQTEAPLNEVLAAGMILKTGWKGESNFVDPMCGSGTLLIEAAMIALNIAPGVHRKEFAFEKWIDFDQELFDRIYNDESQEREFTFKCYGADISPAAIEIAEKNIRSAGLMKYIDLKVQPFQQCTEAPNPGIMVTNPPYGERISSRDLLGLYNMIGERIKHVFTGYKVWILSYKDECFDKIGLKPSEKMKLMNGSLECEYRCYDIFEGKIKDYKKALNEEGEAGPSGFERPDVAGKHSFERRPDRSSDRSSDRPSRPNFKTDRLDRPDRRFAAAHAEDDSERAPFVPGKRYFGDDRADGRPARKDFVAKRPVKKRFKDDEVFGDKKKFGDKKFGDKKFGDKKFGDRKFGDKKFGDQSFRKPFKKRDDDDLED
ncbi:THUMP domain-containing protein [uncultured Parabacteroides sp.]|uniref:THUMP domain-containing class I SAM-dependent RNA methyltransferase n=1 Tax=uncultured Parabacteroides sp. TaxID=512312 RepID=UPI0025F80607|nr:THUMP domain-containing protein [uncultured Parabacteroides sp.]